MSEPKNTVTDLIEAFKLDPDYLWTWHCNIAMGFYDAGGDHKIANEGSARFLQNLTGIDVRKHPHWNV